jgi:HD-GYP domain-containing protein (c-di-GMP phosphodiesterase class II)
VAIVDAFDAMTHDRPYRAGLPLDRALDEFRREASRQFDPDLSELFVAQHTTLAAADGEMTATSFTRGLYALAGVK